MNKPKIIFITGGSASGKSTLASKLSDQLGTNATLISMDSFYKDGLGSDANFDTPEAFNWGAIKKMLIDLKAGKNAIIPVYDFATHSVVGNEEIATNDHIIFEGLFTLYDYELTKHADLKVYVDTPNDTRLARRVMRDINERGRKLEDVIERWQRDVQPSYIKYIHQMKYYADLIIPWVRVKDTSVKAIVQTLKS